MQSADVRDGDHLAAFGRLDLARIWRVAVERLVRARLVVIAEVIGKGAREMTFVPHDHVIQALASNGADEPLDVRILPRGARGADDFFDSQTLDSPLKDFAVDTVAVPLQKSRFVKWKGFRDLLGRPLRRRIGRDVEVQDLSAVEAQHDEHVQ